MIVASILVVTLVSCAGGVFLFRRLAASSNLLLDIPNERSSHTRPVVRGAGIAIVLTVLTGYVFTMGYSANLIYVAAAGSIAVISFIDDLFSIPLLPRLIVHFGAATALVYWSGGYPGIAVPLGGPPIAFGTAGSALTILFIVWVTNAFNFMDGIDGIAGAQGVGAGLGWMLFGLLAENLAVAYLGASITGACLGFLVFNWQPATAFMGDVGSTFLGFTLASMPLATLDAGSAERWQGLLFAFIFLWLFLFDTLYTRISQILRLRPFWRPHREHLYQRIVVGGTSHRAVALYFGGFAVLAAFVAAIKGPTGQISILLLLAVGPVVLLLFARKKRLT